MSAAHVESVRGLPALLLTVLLAAPPALADGPAGPGWQQLRESHFSFWYRDQDERIAEALAEISGSTLDRVVDQTGLPAPGHMDVVLAPDAETFAAAQPSPPPTWAAGTAWPERGEIYLRTRLPRAGPNRIDQVFTHEVVHVVLGRAWRDGRPPRWVTEGLAKYLAGEMGPEDHLLLSRSALSGGLIPLDHFTKHWPRRASQARLAYVQSVDFIAFLAREGDGVLPKVVQELAAGEELDQALLEATGEDMEALEGRWRGRITLWHALFPLLGSSSTLWVLAALLFLVAAWRRRRAFHAKVAEMERREAMSADEPVSPVVQSW